MLIYPVLQVLLLAIIDSARKDENGVVMFGKQWVKIKRKKWMIGAKGWTRVAKVGMPVAFLLIALAILAVGMLSRWYCGLFMCPVSKASTSFGTGHTSL